MIFECNIASLSALHFFLWLPVDSPTHHYWPSKFGYFIPDIQSILLTIRAYIALIISLIEPMMHVYIHLKVFQLDELHLWQSFLVFHLQINFPWLLASTTVKRLGCSPFSIARVTSSFWAKPRKVALIPLPISFFTWSVIKLIVGEITRAVFAIMQRRKTKTYTLSTCSKLYDSSH